MAVIKRTAGKGLVQIWWPLYVINRWPYYPVKNDCTQCCDWPAPSEDGRIKQVTV